MKPPHPKSPDRPDGKLCSLCQGSFISLHLNDFYAGWVSRSLLFGALPCPNECCWRCLAKSDTQACEKRKVLMGISRAQYECATCIYSPYHSPETLSYGHHQVIQTFLSGAKHSISDTGALPWKIHMLFCEVPRISTRTSLEIFNTRCWQLYSQQLLLRLCSENKF